MNLDLKTCDQFNRVWPPMHWTSQMASVKSPMWPVWLSLQSHSCGLHPWFLEGYQSIPSCSGKLWGRKLAQIAHWCCCQKMPRSPISWRKLANSYKTSKFVKVLALLLYGNLSLWCDVLPPLELTLPLTKRCLWRYWVGIILEQVGAKLTSPERIMTLWLALQRASSINEKTGSEEGRHGAK